MKVISVIEDQDGLKKGHQAPGIMGGENQIAFPDARTQPLHNEPHIRYSESQDVPSDNGVYHLGFIQNSRSLFGAEKLVALPFFFKRCSELSC